MGETILALFKAISVVCSELNRGNASKQVLVIRVGLRLTMFDKYLLSTYRYRYLMLVSAL